MLTFKLLTLGALVGSAASFHVPNACKLPRPTRTALFVRRGDNAKAVALASFAAAAVLSQTLAVSPAFAADSTRVGSIPASGFIFKDTLDVTSFSDPKVTGVTLYVSDFSKPITERLQGDFFSDPSTASITCVADGPVKIADDANRGKEGEEVFSEAKSLLFKSVKVRRIIDNDNKNVIYVSFSQKVMSNDDSNKSRFKSSLCAVHAQ